MSLLGSAVAWAVGGKALRSTFTRYGYDMPGGGAIGVSVRWRFCGCWLICGTGSDNGIEMPLLGTFMLPAREGAAVRSFDTGRMGTPFICEPEATRLLVLARKFMSRELLEASCGTLCAGRIGTLP